MAKTIKITQDGLEKLKNELEYLKTEGRTDIAEKIKVARGYGDLSENSEYDEAKNEQAKIDLPNFLCLIFESGTSTFRSIIGSSPVS